MENIGYLLALLAGLIHVYIFYLESVAWKQPRAHRVFGVRTPEEAELLAPAFFNQGFYNLFLALGAIGGALLGFADSTIGNTLALYTTSFMVGAALVLIGSRPDMIRGAIIQGGLPAVAFVLLVVS